MALTLEQETKVLELIAEKDKKEDYERCRIEYEALKTEMQTEKNKEIKKVEDKYFPLILAKEQEMNQYA